jgi:hypothetical protein
MRGQYLHSLITLYLFFLIILYLRSLIVYNHVYSCYLKRYDLFISTKDIIGMKYYCCGQQLQFFFLFIQMIFCYFCTNDRVSHLYVIL